MKRKDFDRDVDTELRDHLERRAADLVRAGMAPGEARRRARVEFGGVEGYKEQLRDERRLASIRILPEQLWRESALAFRRLLATPLFSGFAILSLAVGVGVTTAIFSVMYAVIWRSPGVTRPDELAYVAVADPLVGRFRSEYVVSRADFEDLRSTQTSFRQLAASVPLNQPLISGDIAELSRGEAVSGNYFETLGVRAAMGRVLTASDDRPDAPPTVVLGESFWRLKCGSDPAIVGRVVKIGGVAHTVVGVMPASFRGLGGRTNLIPTDLWTPVATATTVPGGPPPASDRTRRLLTVVGRLATGKSRPAATAELVAMSAALDASFPLPRPDSANAPAIPPARSWSAVSLAHGVPGDGRESTMAAFVVGLTSLVLIVACTNLANLSLARGGLRRREFAIRRALGASRARLVREQLVEHGIVALAGGVGALLVAQGLAFVVQSQLPVNSGLPVDLDLRLQPAVIVAALGSSLLSLAVFGLWPAWRLAGAVPRAALAAAGSQMDSVRWRPRRALIAWQVAVSVGLFLIAVFCVKETLADVDYDTGVDVDRLAILMIDFRVQRWDQSRATRAVESLLSELAQQPGMATSTVTTGLPFSALQHPAYHEIATTESPLRGNTRDSDGAYLIAATPGIFTTLGVPIVRGRGFDYRDDAASRPVVVVSEHIARALFKTVDVVDRQMQIGPDSRSQTPGPGATVATIVGVAADTDSASQFLRRTGTMYVPLTQRYDPFLHIVVRADGAPDALVSAMRAAVRKVEPDLAILAGATGPVVMAPRQLLIRAAAFVMSGLGIVAMVLAMAGLYGVLSQLVSSRTREIGIRIALGAEPTRIRRLVLGDGFRPVAIGLAIALLVGVLGRGLLRAGLTGASISLIDPVAFTLAPLPLVVSAWIACYLPARRAARVDPNVALKDF